uniref:Uncharacterized protein n=1 Tax=uncultured prokaryote TaxID=198431 RepID=A0A0H5Q4M5_9ZZZZ|nr:hypothetical protein [uncultured prokaryote]
MAILNRVRLLTTGVAGSPAYTNLYSLNGAVTPLVAHTAAAAMANSLKTHQNSNISVLVESDVAQLNDATGALVGVVSVPSATYVGSGVGGPLPQANSILIRWLTSSYVGGRQIRGRTYFPYPTAATMNTAGTVAASVITSFNGAVNAYLTALGPAAVVYSPKNATSVPITTASIWTQFAIQRSRRD